MILSEQVARQVIKDLLRGDNAIKQVRVYEQSHLLLNQNLQNKTATIDLLRNQLSKYFIIDSTRKQQLALYEELSSRLKKDLVKERRVKRLYKGSTGLLAGVATYLFIKSEL